MSMFDGNWYIFSGLDDDKLQAVWTQFGLRVSQGYPGTWQMWANSIEAVAFRAWIASGGNPYSWTGQTIQIGNIGEDIKQQIEDIGNAWDSATYDPFGLKKFQQYALIGGVALAAIMILKK